MPKQKVSKASLLAVLFWKLLWSLPSLAIYLISGILGPILVAYMIVRNQGKDLHVHFNETKTFPMNYQNILNGTLGTLDLLYTSDNNEADIIMKTVETMIPANLLIKVVKKKDADEMHQWFVKNHQNISDSIIGIGIIFEKTSKTELLYTMRATPVAFLNTDKQYPEVGGVGPRYAGSFYFQNFFIPVQIAINTGYMDYIGLNKTEWFLQEFPFPPYDENTGFQMIKIWMLFVILACLILKIFMIYFILKEKTSGARELLILNGFKRYMICLYWIVLFAFCSLIVSIGVTYVFTPIFQNTSVILFCLLLFVYSIADIAFALVLCEIFKTASSAIIVYVIISSGMSMIKDLLKYSCVSYIMILLMLQPSMAFSHGLDLMISLEMKGGGLTGKTIMKIDKSTGRGPYLLIIVEMIVSTVIYLFLSSYVYAINPGEFGTAKPWHFIIPNFMKRKFIKKKGEVIIHSLGPTPIVENVKMEPGIKIKNLYKTYGAFNAVNNLSIDLYKNQITALLGHNGAGKSTFFYMITGIKSPTSGQIFYGGENILENIPKFRQSIGFCPQIDISIENLSVQKQIILFGIAKGLSKEKATKDSITIMKKLSFYDKRTAVPKKLSGGTRRKLNLAIALTNNPPILFLDEPTSGLDPESRRHLWDILLTLREGRTIIITTHFMEEADVLGDRIAIMAHGEIRCYGSAMFLKKYYGSGYKLTISYKDESPTALQETVAYFSSGVLESSKGNKLIFNIPIEDTPKLSKMFSTLEGSLSTGSNISVICNSTEDIFLKVQESEGISTAFNEKDISFFTEEREKNGIVVWIFQCFGALLKKRILCYHIGWMSFLMSIFAIIFGTFMLMNMVNTNAKSNLPSLDLVLNNYNDTTVLVSGNPENKVFSAFKSIVDASGATMSIVQQNISNELEKIGSANEFDYTDNYMIAGDFLKVPTVFYSTVTYHGPAIAVNVLFNALIQSVRSEVYIKTSNKPYEFKSAVCMTGSTKAFTLIVGWIMFMFFLLIPISFFITFPMIEKTTNFKHLQYMSGLHPIVYWLTIFLFDVILFSISYLLIMGIIIYFMDKIHYFRDELFASIMLSTLLFGAAMILVCYLTTFLFSSKEIAMLIVIFPVFIIAIVFHQLSEKIKMGNAKYLLSINPLLPYFYILSSITYKGNQRFICSECTVDESECYESDKSIFTHEDVLRNIYILLLDALIFFILLILLDLKLCFWDCFDDKKYEKQQIKEDDDVIQERQVVKNHYEKLVNVGNREKVKSSNISVAVSNSSKTTQDTIDTKTEEVVLLVDGLSKYYSKKGSAFPAAENISFVGLEGECFGVLGASGAGKSTTFGMITGTIHPAEGNALIVTPDKTYSLKWVSSFIKNIGYCPQDNWILGSMTARQLMVHFAKLRGIKNDEIPLIVDWWIKMLDLHLFCDKAFDKYSGGNKRKLSTALALIGEPAVVLLDEPTTGVDPITRRKLWHVFKLIENTNQTMILTSHSMDECEAVCNRLTILRQGRMQCIGDVLYLKKRFALGYTIFIKLTENVDVKSLKKEMIQKFGSKCILTDEHAALLHYHVDEVKFKWSQIFNKMDAVQKTYGCEYMVSDTTLEQVFMSLSQK